MDTPPPVDAKGDATLNVAFDRAIDALLAGIAHRRGEAGSMSPEDALTVWNESCTVFRKEGCWPFPGEAPWVRPETSQPGIYLSKQLTDALVRASLRAALECGVAALRAINNHALGLPAEMAMDEAKCTWLEVNQILRDFEVWTFPGFDDFGWPGMQDRGGACGKPN